MFSETRVRLGLLLNHVVNHGRGVVTPRKNRGVITRTGRMGTGQANTNYPVFTAMARQRLGPREGGRWLQGHKPGLGQGWNASSWSALVSECVQKEASGGHLS